MLNPAFERRDKRGRLLKVRKSAAERFWPKVDVNHPSGCWVWTASIGSRGYGTFGLDGRTQGAHRVAWALWHGEPADGLVCHKCDNPACCNPDHLFVGSVKDNVRDCIAKGRLRPGRMSHTHCIHGHEFTPENTYRWPKAPNQRICRACARDYQARRRAAQREQVSA